LHNLKVLPKREKWEEQIYEGAGRTTIQQNCIFKKFVGAGNMKSFLVYNLDFFFIGKY